MHKLIKRNFKALQSRAYDLEMQGFFIMTGIYKITNPIGQSYVGQTTDNIKRWRHYKNGYCHTQRLLFDSFWRYGFINHTIEMIEICDVEKLDERELFHQKDNNCFGVFGLNSKSNKMINQPKRTEFYKKHNDKKDSLMLIDKFTGIFYDGVSEAAIALSISRSTLSAALNGYRKNRTSIVFAFKDEIKYREGEYCKPVESFDLKTGKTIMAFDSITECESIYGYDKSAVCNVVNGKRKSHKKLGFRLCIKNVT